MSEDRDLFLRGVKKQIRRTQLSRSRQARQWEKASASDENISSWDGIKLRQEKRFLPQECRDVATIHRRDTSGRFQGQGLMNECLRYVFRSHFGTEQITGHVVLFCQAP